jgi:Mg-chelatase subunit ChlD
MRDPVLDREGNTYEKAAIEEWLSRHRTSPLTREPMSVNDLVPNRALRDAIAEYLLSTRVTSSQGLPLATTVKQGPLSLRLIRAESNLLMRVIPSTNEIKRQSLDIVCVVDVSGSMDTDAPVKETTTGPAESKGLTVLDIVKHAAKTVANMLQEGDRFALVTYSDRATVVSPLTAMTSAGKTSIATALASVKADGMTNLWDGLLTAMDLLKSSGEPHRVSSILLLTDGQPNVEPPRGYIPSLERYLDQFGGSPPFTINTFGFGYNLNSTLLNDIAMKSSGMYVFIPDSGLVGTVFVNVVANIQATVATAVTVSLEVPSGYAVSTQHHAQLKQVGFGLHGCIGSVQFEQSRDLFAMLTGSACADKLDDSSPSFHAKISYRYAGVEYTASADACDATTEEQRIIATHSACSLFCKTVLSISSTETPQESLFRHLLSTLNSVAQPHLPLVTALIKDVNGQVAEAMTPASMKKWGKHYLPSLVCANILQQCNNFKDFSVQTYGGAFFATLRDVGEAVFVKLPPPVSSKKTTSSSSKSYVAPPATMHTYYNCGGGCVLGHCLVALLDGTDVSARNIRRGHVLHSGATVECVVKVRVSPVQLPLVRFASPLMSGLCITEYHPIRVNNTWQFPVSVAGGIRSVEDGHEFVYTFLLDHSHVVMIEGIEVAALGHGFTDNEVIAHSYLGSVRVRDDIRKLPGYAEEGVVTIQGFLRDQETQKIEGIAVRTQLLPEVLVC